MEQGHQPVIEEIQKMPTNTEILARFPGQIFQVITGQWRLGAVKPQEADFHLIGSVLMLRRQRRHHVTAGKPQAGRGREPDAFLAGLIVTATLQVVSMVPVNQIHQLKKTVSPRVAENGFQPGYISGC